MGNHNAVFGWLRLLALAGRRCCHLCHSSHHVSERQWTIATYDLASSIICGSYAVASAAGACSSNSSSSSSSSSRGQQVLPLLLRRSPLPSTMRPAYLLLYSDQGCCTYAFEPGHEAQSSWLCTARVLSPGNVVTFVLGLLYQWGSSCWLSWLDQFRSSCV